MKNLVDRVQTSVMSAILLFGSLASVTFAAGGKPTNAPPQAAQAPQEIADRAYNAGLAYRDKAWRLTEEAEGALPEEAERLHQKVRKQYQRAISEFKVATHNSPRMYQAFSSLGYALRKTGEFEQALEAYDRALEIEPSYSEAVEYRGETYLHLGRLEEVKAAYLHLFTESRAHADELMEAIVEWLEDDEKGNVEGLFEFRRWIEERQSLANQTSELAGHSRSWVS